MPRLIAVNGFKESGKDTFARFIIESAPEGYKIERRAFADRLKLLAVRALGLRTDDDLDRDEERLALADKIKATGVFDVAWDDGVSHVGTHFTGRRYLQWLGAEARKVFGDSFWVDQVLPNPAATTEGWPGSTTDQALVREYAELDAVIITDCRYPNEAQRVLDLGGVVIEIVRPGQESDGHSSEQPLPRELVTTTVTNGGTLDDLAAQAAAIGGLYLGASE